MNLDSIHIYYGDDTPEENWHILNPERKSRLLPVKSAIS